MGKIAFVFPGQASQYPGMGKELAEKYPAALAVFEEADKALGFSNGKGGASEIVALARLLSLVPAVRKGR